MNFGGSSLAVFTLCALLQLLKLTPFAGSFLEIPFGTPPMPTVFIIRRFTHELPEALSLFDLS
jgi:hypothetical protein